MKHLVSIGIYTIISLTLFTGCSVKKVTRFRGVPDRPIPQIQEELRGIWVTRFDWTDRDPGKCQQRIKDIMESAAEANFNAVFFQVRGEAETLYPSPIESWSKIFGHQDPGFDPLALAISEAHRRDLKFHAYVNLLPLWSSNEPPTDTSHIYFKHGPQLGPGQSWVCFEPSGRPMALNEYYYLNPALPEVKTHLKKVIRHLAENYQIDGIHFDRIRYPGPQYLYDPYSAEKFLSDSMALNISREEWARQNLTDLVEDVVAEALTVKPYLSISAATWGLYRTDDLKKYEHFGSGYQQYYQDAIGWLDRGIMDFIVPMVYWDIKKPRPNFHELWDDFKERTPLYRKIYPGLIVREGWLQNGETISQVHYIRQNDGLGHVLFSYRAVEGSGQKMIREILYPDRAPVPAGLKSNSHERVMTIKLGSWPPGNEGGTQVNVQNEYRINKTDTEDVIGLIFPEKPDTIVLISNGKTVSANPSAWYPPFTFALDQDGSLVKTEPLLEMRSRVPEITSTPEYHPLFKTHQSAHAEINGEPVKIYKTGIFFKGIDLQEGSNRIMARVTTGDSASAMYEQEVIYREKQPREPLPLWIEGGSAGPEGRLVLTPEDQPLVSFTGSKGQRAYLEINPGGIHLPFHRRDFSDYSRYETTLPFSLLSPGQPYTGTIVLSTVNGQHTVRHLLEAGFEVQPAHRFPVVGTTAENSLLEYSLGPIRLGSPLIAEYDSGVLLQSNGIIGNYQGTLPDPPS